MNVKNQTKLERFGAILGLDCTLLIWERREKLWWEEGAKAMRAMRAKGGGKSFEKEDGCINQQRYS